jgi:hypothetical protein
MRKFVFALVTLAVLASISAPAPAGEPQFWTLVSPDHGQTFAYGSETNRSWNQRGRHLVVFLTLTNDPYVGRDNPRIADNFEFSFPGVIIGADGQTFYYRTPGGRMVPVAAWHSGFLGIRQLNLLSNAQLIVFKPHGNLTLVLNISG